MDTQSSYNGIPIVYGNDPNNVIAAMTANNYSVLSIPAYWRAFNLVASKLADFPRDVNQNGAKYDQPHRLDRFLRLRPNSYQSASTFWRTFFGHAFHAANGYAEITTNKGRIEAHNVCPEDVTPFRLFNGDQIEQWYAVTQQGRPKRVIAGPNMLHIRGQSHDGMTGINHVALFSETFQRAKALDRFTTKYLMKGTVVIGSVEIPYEATDEQVKDILDIIRKHYQGPQSDRDVMVLAGGAKLNNAGLSMQDSQIVEHSGLTTKQIAQVTGVDPEFLYERSESKYNNTSEAAGTNLVRYTLMPWIEQVEDELSVKLLTDIELDAGFTIKLDPDALMRGDTAAVNAAVTSTVNAGVRTQNEGRALLDLPPITDDPNADKLRTLGDTTPQASRGTPAAPAAAPQPPQKNSAEPEVKDLFAGLAPVLDAAISRVEDKTAKAFDCRKGLEGQERTIWANVFSTQQAAYVAEALRPVSAAAVKLGGAELPVKAIGERYAAAIRRRAATEEIKPLAEIVAETIGGHHAEPEQ